jgi:hypothetical protein
MAKTKSKTLGERILNAVGLESPRQIDARIFEAYADGRNESANDDPADAARGLRSGGMGYKSVTAMARAGTISFWQNAEVAWALWQSNPICSRALELKRDYIVGDGVQVTSADERLQAVIDSFWEHNAMDTRLGEFALQLFLFGAQCFPVFVRESDGLVTLGYIDPSEIETVVTNPDNVLDTWAVVIKAKTAVNPWESASPVWVYRVIKGAQPVDLKQARKPWELAMLNHYGVADYAGSCFLYRVNSVSNQPLGYSDLLQVADYADQWDSTLYALGEREAFADFFSFDVTMTGANETMVKTRAGEIRNNPPARGSVLVHNDAESWAMLTPDLKQQASIATVGEQRLSVLGGLGIPDAWFGTASGTHLATAQAQGDPTWRSLKQSQGVIKAMITEMVTFAVEQAKEAGAYYGDGEFEVIMPEMTARDLTATTSALSALASALMTAVQSKWITDEQAGQAFARVLSETGTDIDPAEAAEAAEIETGATDENALSWQSFFTRQAPVEG